VSTYSPAYAPSPPYGSSRWGFEVPPGNPHSLRSAASELIRLGEQLSASASELAGAASNLLASWQGPGSVAFEKAASGGRNGFEQLNQLHQDASSALSQYATTLASCQEQARQAIVSYDQVVETSDTALATLRTSALAAHTGAAASIDATMQQAYRQAMATCSDAYQRAESAAAACASTLAEVASASTSCAATNFPLPPSLIDQVASANDKAGWVLNAWGIAGAFLTAKAAAAYAGSVEAYRAASEAAGGANSAKWNMGDQPERSQWSSLMREAKTAKGEMAEAHDDFETSMAPEAGSWGVMDTLGRAGLVLGMGSDVVTLLGPSKPWGPGDALGGNFDRGMAAANFAASGVALSSSLGMTFGMEGVLMAVPGVDVAVGVVMVGTTLYFTGEFVYRHWSDITHFATGAWHTVSSWGGDVARGAGSLWHSATSWL
jgi:uncharacterized protein YukE